MRFFGKIRIKKIIEKYKQVESWAKEKEVKPSGKSWGKI